MQPAHWLAAVVDAAAAAAAQGSKQVRVAPAPARGCARTRSTRACSWEYGRNGRGCRRVRVVSCFGKRNTPAPLTTRALNRPSTLVALNRRHPEQVPPVPPNFERFTKESQPQKQNLLRLRLQVERISSNATSDSPSSRLACDLPTNVRPSRSEDSSVFRRTRSGGGHPARHQTSQRFRTVRVQFRCGAHLPCHERQLPRPLLDTHEGLPSLKDYAIPS